MQGNITQAYQFMIDKCEQGNCGYSQTYREGQIVNGIEYYDCSSIESAALTYAGFFNENPWFTTRSMESYLLSLGFTKSDASIPWKAGDILWRSGHTEMVYQPTENGGYTMGAHSASYPLEKQVSINDTPTDRSAWVYLYRWRDGGALPVSLYVVSALCGNFWQESTINPGLWEGQSAGSFTDLLKGFGLGQWTNTGGNTQGRLYQLHAWLQENNFPDDSGQGQLAYLVHENTWYSTGVAAQYNSLSEFLASDSTDIDLLVEQYMVGWEGISDGTLSIRQEAAHNCYNFILDHANDEAIENWIVGNRYLSADERYNNAVMVYRYFNGGIVPPEPTPIVKRKHMPIWFYCYRR